MKAKYDKVLSFGDEYIFDNMVFKDIFVNNNKINYAISNTGLVLNTRKMRILEHSKKKKDSDKYIQLHVFIANKRYTFSIHRLVALAYIPVPKDKLHGDITESDLDVNHKDYNKTNNDVSNLEWVTKSENIKYSVCNRKEKSPIADEETVHKICSLLEENKLSAIKISKKLNVSLELVYRILQKEYWTRISDQYDIDNYTKKTTRKYSDDTIHTICKYLEENEKTVKEIAQIADVPKNVVHQILYGYIYQDIANQYNIRNYSIKGFVKIYSDETVEKVCELLMENKLTPVEIGKITGVPDYYVRNCMRYEERPEITTKYDFSHYDKYIDRHDYNDLNHDVDKLILAGYSNQEIRERLFIDKNKTTKSYINNHRIALRKKCEKLGIRVDF